MAQWIFDRQAQTWFDVDTQTALPRGVTPNDPRQNGFITMQGEDGLYGFNPEGNLHIPMNADFTQDLERSQGDEWMEMLPYLWLGGAGLAAGGAAVAGGAGAGTAGVSEAAIADALAGGTSFTGAGAGLSTSGALGAQTLASGVGSGVGTSLALESAAGGGTGGAEVFQSGMDFGLTGAEGAVGATPTGAGMDWWDELMMETGEFGIDPAALEGGYNSAASLADYNLGADFSLGDIAKYGTTAWNALKGGLGGLMPSGNNAAALAPILAAIAYAKNQGGFDTSRLESTYNEFDPKALAFEYDQNTAKGRDALTSSLTNRGVMGSSFGNMDMTNFQTTRDLGRRSLINQGVLARTDPAKAILDAQIKERALKNDLYGRSLMSLGNVFGGKR